MYVYVATKYCGTTNIGKWTKIQFNKNLLA